MKKYIALLTIVITLTSCVGTKRYTSIVKENTVSLNNLKNNPRENIIFNTDYLTNQDSLVVSKNIKNEFIPVFIYWGWNKTIQIDLNPKTVSNLFVNTFNSQTDFTEFNENLKGKKIELSIEKLPTTFYYTEKGFVVYMLIVAFYGGGEAIVPKKQDLVVKYKLIQDEKEIKSGELVAIFRDSPLKNKNNSRKKFTGHYIEQYKGSMKRMSEDIVNQLLNELEMVPSSEQQTLNDK